MYIYRYTNIKQTQHQPIKHEGSTNLVKDLFMFKNVMLQTRVVPSCLAIVFSCLEFWRLVLPCLPVMSGLVWSWFVFPRLSHFALPCRVMSCLLLPSLASLRFAVPCRA